MPLSRRYTTEWSPLDNCTVGMDFSAILPVGVGIEHQGEDYSQEGTGGVGYPIPTPRLEIWTNSNPPIAVPEDWYINPGYTAWPAGWYWQLDETTNVVTWVNTGSGGAPSGVGIAAVNLAGRVVGRSVYANVGGGAPGTDYQFRWTITDTLGNRWTRTGLVLCAETS